MADWQVEDTIVSLGPDIPPPQLQFALEVGSLCEPFPVFSQYSRFCSV